MMNIINGGSHDAQLLSRIYDYTSESDFVYTIQMGSEIFHSLKKYYTIGLSTAVGDEGGPNFSWRY
jgi:enolase